MPDDVSNIEQAHAQRTNDKIKSREVSFASEAAPEAAPEAASEAASEAGEESDAGRSQPRSLP